MLHALFGICTPLELLAMYLFHYPEPEFDSEEGIDAEEE